MTTCWEETPDARRNMHRPDGRRNPGRPEFGGDWFQPDWRHERHQPDPRRFWHRQDQRPNQLPGDVPPAGRTFDDGPTERLVHSFAAAVQDRGIKQQLGGVEAEIEGLLDTSDDDERPWWFERQKRSVQVVFIGVCVLAGCILPQLAVAAAMSFWPKLMMLWFT